MSGALAAALLTAGGRLAGTLAIGTDGISSYGFIDSSFGTLTPATFLDGGGTTRTVKIWQWSINASGTVDFRLNGTGISNADSTFYSITIQGRTLLRSSATYTSNDGGGRSKWAWSIDTSAYPSSGTVPASVQ